MNLEKEFARNAELDVKQRTVNLCVVPFLYLKSKQQAVHIKTRINCGYPMHAALKMRISYGWGGHMQRFFLCKQFTQCPYKHRLKAFFLVNHVNQVE